MTGLLLVGLFGALSTFRSFSWESFLASMASFDSFWVMGAMLVSMAQVALQLLRFWVVFRPEDRPSAWDLHWNNLIGQTLNSLAPLRSGDAYKLLKLKEAGASMPAVGAGLVTERVADGLALLALSGFSGLSLRTLSAVGLGAIVATLCLRSILRRAHLFPEGARPFLEQLSGFTAKVGESLFSRRFVHCVLISGLTWAFDAGTLVCSARAAGIALSPFDAMTSVFALNLGIAVPLTVANVGVFEASLGFALMGTVPGLALEKALSVATLEHAAKIGGLLGCLLLGFLALAVRRVRVREGNEPGNGVQAQLADPGMEIG